MAARDVVDTVFGELSVYIDFTLILKRSLADTWRLYRQMRCHKVIL